MHASVHISCGPVWAPHACISLEYQLYCLLLLLEEAIYEARYYRYLLAHLQGQVEARVEAAPPHSACR